MSPDPATSPIELLQAQLRSALDEQIGALSRQYEAALNQARETAAADAEEAALTRIREAREEFERRLAAESSARAEAERKLTAETTRIRMEAEQQAAEAAGQLREELEHALTAERQRADAAVQAERRNADAALQAEKARADAAVAEKTHAEAELVAERQRLQAQMETAVRDAAAAAERMQTAKAGVDADAVHAQLDALTQALDTIGGGTSLTAILDALLDRATAMAGRAAILLVNGDRIRSWRARNLPALEAQEYNGGLTGASLIAQAANGATAVPSSETLPAPAFASLPPDGRALAVPLTVGGRAVAVLYADDGGATETPAGWPRLVEAMARHAAAALALHTAVKTTQLFATPQGPQPAGTSGASAPDPDAQGARRYARLLVSEIKLYNEAAVRVGRQNRDLLDRLAPEIDRARRLYEERVSPSVGARAVYFQQELVQTLADGDPALLGSA